MKSETGARATVQSLNEQRSTREASSEPVLSRLQSQPGHLIRRAQQVAVAIFMDECTRFDLTPVQYASLSAIEAHPDCDATRLSALIAFDRSTLGDVLERLEAKNLLSRRPTSRDKRIKLLRITSKGRRLLTNVAASADRAQQRMLAPLTHAERKTLMALLTKMTVEHNESSRVPQRAALQLIRS